MSDRPASWRMPTTKQLEKMAERHVRQEVSLSSSDEEAWWQSVMADPPSPRPRLPIQQRRLSEIPRHVLRVECSRCGRIVEIQTVDAVRLYGPHAVWKDVGQKLLDDGCQVRTGRYEEDGCWPQWAQNGVLRLYNE
nr:hypothetical protein [Afipia sp. Root123D2]